MTAIANVYHVTIFIRYGTEHKAEKYTRGAQHNDNVRIRLQLDVKIRYAALVV